MDNTFSLLQLLIGGYLLYAAVTGKGKLYENEFLKVPREEYVKTLRIMSAIAGSVLAVSSLLEYLKVITPGSTASWIVWGLGFLAILPMMVYTSKSTDKEAARASQNNKPASPSSSSKDDPLRAAFVFDEEEETDKIGNNTP